MGRKYAALLKGALGFSLMLVVAPAWATPKKTNLLKRICNAALADPVAFASRLRDDSSIDGNPIEVRATEKNRRPTVSKPASAPSQRVSQTGSRLSRFNDVLKAYAKERKIVPLAESQRSAAKIDGNPTFRRFVEREVRFATFLMRTKKIPANKTFLYNDGYTARLVADRALIADALNTGKTKDIVRISVIRHQARQFNRVLDAVTVRNQKIGKLHTRQLEALAAAAMANPAVEATIGKVYRLMQSTKGDKRKLAQRLQQSKEFADLLALLPSIVKDLNPAARNAINADTQQKIDQLRAGMSPSRRAQFDRGLEQRKAGGTRPIKRWGTYYRYTEEYYIIDPGFFWSWYWYLATENELWLQSPEDAFIQVMNELAQTASGSNDDIPPDYYEDRVTDARAGDVDQPTQPDDPGDQNPPTDPSDPGDQNPPPPPPDDGDHNPPPPPPDDGDHNPPPPPDDGDHNPPPPPDDGDQTPTPPAPPPVKDPDVQVNPGHIDTTPEPEPPPVVVPPPPPPPAPEPEPAPAPPPPPPEPEPAPAPPEEPPPSTDTSTEG